MQYLGIARNLRLAEAGDALLVEDPGDGVHALHRAAVRMNLHGAVVQQADRRRARRRLHRRLPGHGEAVAVRPAHQRLAPAQRELPAQGEVPRRQTQRLRACAFGGRGVTRCLEQASQPPQWLRAARRDRRRGLQGPPRRLGLASRRLHVGELVQAGGLRRAGGGEQRVQLFGPAQIATIPHQRGERGRSVVARKQPFGEGHLFGQRALPPSELVEQRPRVAAARIGPQRGLGARAGRRRISLRIEQARASELQARRQLQLLRPRCRGDGGVGRRRGLALAEMPQRGFRLLQLLRRILVALGLALQRGRGDPRAQEERVLARGLAQVGQRARAPEPLRDFRIAQDLLGVQGQGGSAGCGQRDGPFHRGARGGALVPDDGPREQPGAQRISVVVLEQIFREAAQRPRLVPSGACDAGLAQRARGLQARSGQLRRGLAGEVCGSAVGAHQREPEARSLRAAPADQRGVRPRPQPHRRRLRARRLARIGNAGDRHRAVEAQLEGRRSLHPGEVVPPVLHLQVASCVEDVAFARIEVQARVSVGKFEGTRKGGPGGTHRRGGPRRKPVQRERPRQIEQPQRRKRPGDAPALDGPQPGPDPGFRLWPRFPYARRGRPPGRLAQEPRGARSQAFRGVLRGSRDRVVHRARVALGFQQPDRGELGSGIARRGRDGVDPGRGRRARLQTVLEDLGNAAERERPRRARAGLRNLAEPRLGPLRIRCDQVAQPSRTRSCQRVARSSPLRFVQPAMCLLLRGCARSRRASGVAAADPK